MGLMMCDGKFVSRDEVALVPTPGGGATCQRTLLLKIFYAQMIKKFAEAICHFIESYRTAKNVSGNQKSSKNNEEDFP